MICQRFYGILLLYEFVQRFPDTLAVSTCLIICPDRAEPYVYHVEASTSSRTFLKDFCFLCRDTHLMMPVQINTAPTDKAGFIFLHNAFRHYSSPPFFLAQAANNLFFSFSVMVGTPTSAAIMTT